jgi:hypothetical protein
VKVRVYPFGETSVFAETQLRWANTANYLKRYWRYMRALSSTSAWVTWVRPREATLSSMRLRMKRRMRKGLRLMRWSASGSQVIRSVFAKVLAFLLFRFVPVFYRKPLG